MYATLTQFYLHLRSKERQLKKMENHPVVNMLLRVQELIGHLEHVDAKKFSVQADSSIEMDQSNSDDETILPKESTMLEPSDSEGDDGFYEQIKMQTLQKKRNREDAISEMKQEMQQATR